MGDMYSAAVTHIIKSAASQTAYDMKEKRAHTQVLTHMSIRNDQGEPLRKEFITLENYVQKKGKLGSSRLTAPYRDVGAAYDLWQWKKRMQGTHPEGGKEAQRAVNFINEQTQTFSLRPVSDPMQCLYPSNTGHLQQNKL